MHDIKFIRENLDKFKKLIHSRNVKINFDEIIELDLKNNDV